MGRGRIGTFLTKDRILDLLHLHWGFGYLGLEGDEARKKVESLLGDYDRYFSVQTGNISNLSKRDQNARNLLIGINALTLDCLSQAETAMQAAQAAYASVETYDSEYINGYNNFIDAPLYLRRQDPKKSIRRAQAYWSEHHETCYLAGGFEDLDQLLCATSHFSPSYLQWIAELRKKKPSIQALAIKWLQKELLLEKEAETIELSCIFKASDDEYQLEQERQQSATLRAALEHHQARCPESIAFLKPSRAHLIASMSRLPWLPNSDGPHVLEPSIHTGWPFPLVFKGDESTSDVYCAQLAYEALGDWMVRAGAGLELSMNAKDDAGNAYLPSRVDALNRNFRDAMQQVHQAGALLKSIANLLKVLSDPLPDTGRCELCYRRIGPGKRKYCNFHGEQDMLKVSVLPPRDSGNAVICHRTSLRQSQKIAPTYIARSNSLLRELRDVDFFKDPERVLSAQMEKIRKQHRGFGPITSSEIALKQHRSLMALLREVAGDLVYAELAQQSDILCAQVELCREDLSSALKGLEAARDAKHDKIEAYYERALDSGLHVKLSIVELCDAHIKKEKYTLKEHAKCVIRHEALVEQACRGITVEGYFFAFFNRVSGHFKTTDEINHLARSKGGNTYSHLKNNAFSLAEIVRDDIRALRAWKEIGGDRIDELMAQERGLEIDHARKRFSLEEVRSCLDTLAQGKALDYQPSYQKVADELQRAFQVRVTHTAIFQKIRRSGDPALQARFFRKK